MADVKLNAVVREREDLTDNLMILRVAPDGWALPAFDAGQFAVLGLPAEAPRHAGCEDEKELAKPNSMVRRAYSVTSSSRGNEYLEFLIRLVHTGALTPRLWRLRVGDRLWLGPKITGLFTLAAIPADAHLVMLATGTGLAPYMSMVRTYLEEHRGRNFAIMHGAGSSRDLSFRAELERLQQEFVNFKYVPVVTDPNREPTPWQGATGVFEDVWRAGLIERLWGFPPSPKRTHVLLCGNPAMIDSMTALLKEQGFAEHSKVQPGQIHAEHYW